MDWFDQYLDALSDPGATLYFPPDAPYNARGAKQRLMFDAVASSEEEMRNYIQTTRYTLEHHSGDSAYQITSTSSYLIYSPSSQTIFYTTAGGFQGTSANTTLAAFQAIPVTTPASIALSGSPVITTITGLNYYTNLVSFNIANQGRLAVASLSANTFPTSLVDLNLSNNALTSPDVNNGSAFRTKIAQIQYLDLSLNNFASALTFSNATNLVTLNLSANKLTPSNVAINLNTNLKSINLDKVLCANISVSNNSALSSISLSGTGTGSGLFDCSVCNLSSLNLSNFNINAVYLACTNNKLKTLDCSPFSNLINLNCHTNSLTSLTLPSAGNTMSDLYCYSNQLTALDLNKSCLASVSQINAQNNSLTGVDLSIVAYSTNLSYLYFQNNKLTAASLDTMIATLNAGVNSTGLGTQPTFDFSGTGNASITDPTTQDYISSLREYYSCNVIVNGF